MSPEQALDERVDYRTDIFSLGIVIFEMLTGRLPFVGSSLGALGLQIIQAPAPAPSSANASLPAEFDRIVTKALAKSIDQRYESAVTLAAELRSVGAILDVRSDAAGPEIVHGPIHVPERRSPAWLVLLCLLAALAAAGWWQRDAIAEAWHRFL
jgi:serine/threonine protein kinase